jgi:hypothetical protein
MSHRFWIAWSVLTAAGWAAGLGAALFLGAPIEVVVGMMLVTPAVTGLAGGVLGIGQWWALRGRPGARWWAPTSAIGLGVGLTVGVTLVEQLGRWLTGGPVNVARLTTLERAGSFAVIGLMAGLFLGAAQWLVLRHAARRSGTWAVHTTLAMTAALVAASLLADGLFGGVTVPIGFGSFVLLSGATFGVLTGLSMRVIMTSGV